MHNVDHGGEDAEDLENSGGKESLENLLQLM